MATKREIEKAKSYEKKGYEYLDKAKQLLKKHEAECKAKKLTDTKDINALYKKKYAKAFDGYLNKGTELLQKGWNWRYNNGKPLKKKD